ncbi:MAG: tRNA (adenosine(37)-N6)-threonylcarbamoyltransferase complex transferase subunit TsaD [candidate division Zixibacteria bacterium]|nr:tRNA (adenosine(37)-N6)-threonylcarbamoyltransferase complex transferase subunit TsaD [candidate division Zixibacteria bacterium]MBU1470457.1 tRNA (adenosine(37)-N6)-threonylcarbamoyltransferase complex transferase subunit TsaD [candidate division Zixibacteria bacterium]MBU2625906.1 tRNA (adenosine(37)-N6)-threonylcarbamoyltransferase complex transferase subunit TsaD [candidate division Zixibacteria bacterium]
MIVLGIETSCDETSCALIDERFRIFSNAIYSQLEHEKYGGIVPEVASRQQIKKIYPIYRECLKSAGLAIDDIDAIAVTCGPGLIGSLLVGVNFAKGVAYATKKKIIGINHLEGHLCSSFLEHDDLKPPFISLIISGGHTLLIHVKDYCEYEILGQTRDDAAGEAYDKVAKLLGLGYPGGRKIDELARSGNPKFHKFPRATVRKDPLAFSFSGLKTAVVLFVRDKTTEFIAENLNHICASFQEAVVDMLATRCLRALDDLKLDKLVIGGGVAANRRLREFFGDAAKQRGFKLYYPSLELCTDNGAMIAAAGLIRLQRGESSDLTLDASAQLPLV